MTQRPRTNPTFPYCHVALVSDNLPEWTDIAQRMDRFQGSMDRVEGALSRVDKGTQGGLIRLKTLQAPNYCYPHLMELKKV